MDDVKLVKFDLSNESDKIASEEFLDNKEREFGNYDIFEATLPFEIKPHYHADIEARFIITGTCTFEIGGKSIECGPGTYIELASRVEHSFSYNSKSKLKVLRFFGDNEKWEAIYV